MMTLSRLESYTAAGNSRPGGRVVGLTLLQAVPSYSWAGSGSALPLLPPQRKTFETDGSYTIAWSALGPGFVLTVRCVQFRPSHVQDSLTKPLV